MPSINGKLTFEVFCVKHKAEKPQITQAELMLLWLEFLAKGLEAIKNGRRNGLPFFDPSPKDMDIITSIAQDLAIPEHIKEVIAYVTLYNNQKIQQPGGIPIHLLLLCLALLAKKRCSPSAQIWKDLTIDPSLEDIDRLVIISKNPATATHIIYEIEHIMKEHTRRLQSVAEIDLLSRDIHLKQQELLDKQQELIKNQQREAKALEEIEAALKIQDDSVDKYEKEIAARIAATAAAEQAYQDRLKSYTTSSPLHKT